MSCWKATSLFVALLSVGTVLGQDNCAAISGTCQDYVVNYCMAGYLTGLCNGGDENLCCLPCDTDCQSEEDNWSQSDGSCTASGGTCMLNSNYCFGSYQSGQCGGPAERQCCSGYDLTYPDPEFRAVFMATVANIDWPADSGQSTTEQQAQLDEYVDILSKMNSNAIMFQVRPAADAFYSSSLEPWSKWLTGTQGVAPSPFYDPLEYLITAAHAKGIEVHAWLNPYRAANAPSTSGLDSSHICMTQSQYCYQYGNYMWLDPGADVIANHLISVIEDIVTRYDVDGIHYDDYFYPYPVDGVDFPDDSTYNDYLNSGGSLSRDDWRRDNVNRMVEDSNSAVKAIKSTCRFSISPFGIYRPGEPEGMPSPIVGLDPYSEQYADTKLWLQMGWVDFLAPQLYWKIDPPGQSYPVLLDWWISEDVNVMDRHVYASNAVYRVIDDGWPTSEIVNQVDISRDQSRRDLGSLGNIHFSAKYFRDNSAGLYDTFRAGIQPDPVSVPSMPWLGKSKPNPINLVNVERSDENLTVEVKLNSESRYWLIGKVEETNHVKIIAKTHASSPKLSLSMDKVSPGVYVVQGIDGGNNAGLPQFFRI